MTWKFRLPAKKFPQGTFVTSPRNDYDCQTKIRNNKDKACMSVAYIIISHGFTNEFLGIACLSKL